MKTPDPAGNVFLESLLILENRLFFFWKGQLGRLSHPPSSRFLLSLLGFPALSFSFLRVSELFFSLATHKYWRSQGLC